MCVCVRACGRVFCVHLLILEVGKETQRPLSEITLSFPPPQPTSPYLGSHTRRFHVRGLQLKLLNALFNPLNPELNPICYLLALLAHHFLHVSRIMVKSLPLRLLMSHTHIYIYIYIYMEHLFLMFLDHIRRRSIVGMTPLDE